MDSYQKIIIRMPNWIGDAVMASPVIALVRRNWPDAEVTLFGLSHILSLFEKDPCVDKFLPITKKDSPTKIIYSLREKKYNLGILLAHSFSSAWLFFRAHIPHRWGYSKDMRAWMLTNSKPLPAKKSLSHHIETYTNLLNGSKNNTPKLFVSSEEEELAKKFLTKREIKSNDLIIGVNPSAAYGPSKCWPEQRFHEVALRLAHEKNAKLLFFGDESSYEKNNRIISGLDRAFNLAGKTTLRELMALIKKCDLFLTNDSGPMHIACALSVPVVAIFGSTSPNATGPYNKGIYLYEKVDCSPCYKRECPIDFRCMKAISSDHVFNAIDVQLKKYSKKICVQN